MRTAGKPYTDQNADLPNNYLYSGAVCPDGQIAITHISGVVLFDGTAFKTIPETNAYSSPEGIACDADGGIWVGRNMLACKTLVRDVGTSITVEPLLGLKVVKDLIVDMEPFFDNYKKVLPYFINESPLPADGKERLQSPEQRERFDDTTKCILCAACTTSCPSFWTSDDYLGPAALVTTHRFIFDSRDESASERLHIVSETSGVARCHTVFTCTMACPREIQITKAFGELKMAMITGKIE